MSENARKPSIRFAGFDDAWEQRKFGMIVVPYLDPIETPIDGYNRLGIRSHAKGTFHNYVKPGMQLETAQMHRVAAGNFIVNITFGWEHAVAITDQNDEGKLVSHRFPQFKFLDGMQPKYFKLLILDEKFRHHLWLSSPGGAGRNRVLNIKEMLEYPFWITSESEQKKIADFFIKLDILITLHQRKLEKLKNIKKSMLEKMFPKNGSDTPEIRFAGFADPWEQRKWSETVDISTEMVDPKCGEYDDLPHVAPGNIESFTGRVFDNVKTVKEENLISGKFHFYDGDIIYGKINPQLGKYAFVRFEGLTSADAYVLNSKNGLDQKFLFTLIQSDDFYRYTVSVSRRSGMPKINRDGLNSFTYISPTTDEQSKIGEIFLSLDNLITLHQREFEKLKNIKKSMLEKMFV